MFEIIINIIILFLMFEIIINIQTCINFFI